MGVNKHRPAAWNRLLIEELFLREDQRGSVLEPLAPVVLAGQRNVHVVLTEPGGVRGNHLHRRGTEVLAVYGPALVRTREDGRLLDTEVPAGRVVRFTIPPGVSHAVRNTGSGPLLIVAFNTEPHDLKTPDAVPDLLIPAE